MNNNNNNNYLLNYTPQKRVHHLITPEFNNNTNTNNNNHNELQSFDIDLERLNDNNNIKRVKITNDNKLIDILRVTLRNIFINPNYNIKTITSEEGIIKLIEALVPQYSLGKGWTMNSFPYTIPNYPFFNNEYNKLHNNIKPINHNNYHIGDINYESNNNKSKLYTVNSDINMNKIPSKYVSLNAYSSVEWDSFGLDKQANIWSENFAKHVENYKYKLHTSQNILLTDKITANMLSFGLQINILYILKIINKNKEKNDKILNRKLFKYYIRIKELLQLWEKYIELNNFNNHINNTNYLINCLLTVGHGFLMQGILIQQIENNKILARKSYTKCIKRIRFVHKYMNNLEENQTDEIKNRFKIKQFLIDDKWTPISIINSDTLCSNCCEWNWLHYDLNKENKYYDFDIIGIGNIYDYGPYDGWIIESYNRLAWTYDNGTIEKFNYLHTALKLLRNKDGLSDIVSVKIIIDYAYTFLEQGKKCIQLDKYYWFYLINITFGLINMNKNNGLTPDAIFNIKTRFLCTCIINALTEQQNYISIMQNFIKDNMNIELTLPANAIHRFLRIGYICMYYGDIREGNDLYRCCRALMQYYGHHELSEKKKYGERLMDNFEIWWDFNYFCIYSISIITSYCVINYDSSYFNLLWDWVCWRNQCSKMMFKIGGLPNDKNAVKYKYYGYFNEYKLNAQNLAFFGAQAMILGVIHSAENYKLNPDYKYLYTIVLLLEMAKKNAKFKHHCQILGHYMEQQFELFGWTPERKRQLTDVIVID